MAQGISVLPIAQELGKELPTIKQHVGMIPSKQIGPQRKGHLLRDLPQRHVMKQGQADHQPDSMAGRQAVCGEGWRACSIQAGLINDPSSHTPSAGKAVNPSFSAS
jgi:hypothetical protein